MKKRTNSKAAKAVKLVTRVLATEGCNSASGWFFYQPKAPKNPYKTR